MVNGRSKKNDDTGDDIGKCIAQRKSVKTPNEASKAPVLMPTALSAVTMPMLRMINFSAVSAKAVFV